MYDTNKEKVIRDIESFLQTLLKDNVNMRKINPYKVVFFDGIEEEIIEITIQPEKFINDWREKIYKYLEELTFEVFGNREENNSLYQIVGVIRSEDNVILENHSNFKKNTQYENSLRKLNEIFRLYYPKISEYSVSNEYISSKKLIFTKYFVIKETPSGDRELIKPKEQMEGMSLQIKNGGVNLDIVRELIKEFKDEIRNLLRNKDRQRINDQEICGPGEEWVKAYIKADGTSVKGYCRDKKNNRGGRPRRFNTNKRKRI